MSVEITDDMENENQSLIEIDENEVRGVPTCFEIDGVKQNWYWVWHYEGSAFWENKKKTCILYSEVYLPQIEIFRMFEITISEYCRLVKKLIADEEKGIRSYVPIQDVLVEAGYSKTWYYALHKEPEKLMIFDEDELRETNPEWFI